MNLSADLSGLIDQLEPIARPGGHGRVLMVMGASPGAGASTVARELARLAAQRSSRGVWLYDLDFNGGRQAEIARCSGQDFDAGFGAPPFWSIEPRGALARLTARRSSVSGLSVASLEQAPNEVRRIGLRPAPAYWAAVRTALDLAVVDAPCDAKPALAIAGDADGVILVADARQPNFEGIAARRQAVEARGGVVAGLIYNRDMPAPQGYQPPGSQAPGSPAWAA
jgi:Mrp family chromosome partitioning ATPase